MTKYIALCGISSLLGAMLALSLSKEHAGWPAAAGQEPSRAAADEPRPPQPEAASPHAEPSVPLLAQRPGGPPRAPDALAHLTPEERVNVSVYEKGSSSRINI